MNLTSVDLDGYDERTQWEIRNHAHEGRTLFWTSVFFLAACVAALYYDHPIVGGALFLAGIFFRDGAFEAQLEAAMIRSNWSLALLVNRHTSELLAIRSDLEGEKVSENC